MVFLVQAATRRCSSFGMFLMSKMAYSVAVPITQRTDAECSFEKSSYQMPDNYDLDKIKQEIVNGTGFVLLKNMFSKEDVEEASEIIRDHTNAITVDTNTDDSKSGRHNSYGKGDYTYNGERSGIVWRLLGKGKIFEKIALHPATLEITQAILGPKAKVSSYMANTVQPGMEGQIPHVDYPYYDGYFPEDEKNDQRSMLSIAFAIMLTRYRKENGATVVRPYSQRNPSYPDDPDDFYKNAAYMEGEPGDVGVFAACLQHAAGENVAHYKRVGIVQSMVPVYLAPYHEIDLPEEETKHAPEDFKNLMAIGHPYPMKH